MNTLNLIKLASIFLLSGVLASEKSGVTLNKLVRDGTATLENVKAIFEENAALKCADFVDPLEKLEDPEVVKYVLSKCANMEDSIPAHAIRRILAIKIGANYSGQLNLDEGSPNYEIFVAMLEYIKPYSNIVYRFPFDYSNLVYEGNVPLMEKCAEAGLNMPERIHFPSIKRNKLQTIKFLFENGFNKYGVVRILKELVESNQVPLEDFKYFVDRGLSLECAFLRIYWLVIAFENGRIDIARYLCDKGARLSKDNHMSEEGKRNLENMVHELAKENAFIKYHLMFAGQKYGEEALEYLPKEVVLAIIKPIYEAERDNILQNLYHA